MLDFSDIKIAVSLQMDRMCEHQLFVSAATKEELWETYLSSFPEGTNPIYRERTQHDCSCCRQFIRTAGNTLAVIDGQLVSAWDIDIGGAYQVVADAMSSLIKSRGIQNIFLHYEKNAGTDKTYEHGDDETITWEHFHHELPASCVVPKQSIATMKGKAFTNKGVLERSLQEITGESIEVVLELIDQNSLYRGQEHVGTLKMLSELQSEYAAAENKEYFVWMKSLELKGASAIRNTVIGTLLVDLSNGVDLEDAVRMFESKVAPENYKRPTALITKSMIERANQAVDDLGFGDSLYRRFAVKDDIGINDILFADRSVKASMGVFDELQEGVVAKKPSMEKVEKVSIGDFLERILPKADSLEVYLENRHERSLVSLIAPVHADAPNILAWGNNFSWSYNGDVTDSIRDRVKKAGGSVTGDLRCSLAWSNGDDLDIHIKEPGGEHIYYGHNRSRNTGGRLDVDMNAGGVRNSVDPVENITWAKKTRLREGTYHLFVNNYNKRSNENIGFTVEVEFDGQIHVFHYAKATRTGEDVMVAEFTYSHAEGVRIVNSIPSTTASRQIWGINTNNFHKVSMVMLSPNHWEGEETGNRHFFFMLDRCVNPEKARGLYNEFLSPQLREHRKVFEVLGSKLKAEKSTNQLSGVGFSSTQENNVLCRVKGAFNRVIEIQI